MTTLPPAARLAWWATAWLQGYAVTDLVIDAVVDGDATHVMARLPGIEGTATLVEGLALLRRLGATGLGGAFPAEGDPVGLGGPRPFNADALEAGEAVVVSGTGLGLVPQRTGAAVIWTAQPAERRQLPDVGEADRALRAALLASADALADLDVARWRPEVADRLMDLRHREPLTAPDGIPRGASTSPPGACRLRASSSSPSRTTAARSPPPRSSAGAPRWSRWTGPGAQP